MITCSYCILPFLCLSQIFVPKTLGSSSIPNVNTCSGTDYNWYLFLAFRFQADCLILSYVFRHSQERQLLLIQVNRGFQVRLFLMFVCSIVQFGRKEVNKNTNCGIGNSVATCEHVNHLYFLMYRCSLPLLYVWFCFFKIVIHLFSKLESQTVLLSYVFNE